MMTMSTKLPRMDREMEVCSGRFLASLRRSVIQVGDRRLGFRLSGTVIAILPLHDIHIITNSAAPCVKYFCLTDRGALSMIEKVMKVGDLYELYGTLLTKRGQQMVEMYYFDDWSLAEIADALGVSRQAVHDNLRRAQEQLDAYEVKLHLLELGHQQTHAISHLVSTWETCRADVPAHVAVAMDVALDAMKRLI